MTANDYGYAARIDALRATKVRHTQEKQSVIGAMDFDDHAIVLPPEDNRRMVELMGPSGVPITDVLFADAKLDSNHPSGGAFGAAINGRNFRRILELHQPYIDPMSSLAGCYRTNFLSYRKEAWNPDLSYEHLHERQQRYKLQHGIGAVQHFCQDMTIGYTLGWDGIKAKIAAGRAVNTDAEAVDLYDGLDAVVFGLQTWIRNHADAAERVAESHDGAVRENLLRMATVNRKLVGEPPETFLEAVQWTLWFQMAARMYNSSGSLGRIDLLLEPFYLRDVEAGVLDDEEAIFHLACYFVMDTAYCQVGGPDASGSDVTSHFSYLVLEAAHRLRIPVNVGVSVGDHVDPGLLRRGVEIMVQDRCGTPKFLGVENTARGFARNGYPLSLANERAYSGCHWSALPGREYTLNDCVKINLPAVLEVALWEMLDEPAREPSIELLWEIFSAHLRGAVDATAEGLDFHMAHMWQVFPELMMDLMCHGPIERGRDASHGGVEYVNLCIDGAGLATVADSLAAAEHRIELDERLSWDELADTLRNNWEGAERQRIRQMLMSVPRYGSGDSRADSFAVRTAGLFTQLVKRSPTPAGHNMIPGIFSWAATIFLGKDVGPTPNGRYRQDPISHGPNPDPGFRRDGAPTALTAAVARVQPGWGNTAPLQLEIDPGVAAASDSVALVETLLRTHVQLGGTQVNLNVVDRETILAAHKNPEQFPELVVRVTGFSAYFASLSEEFRELVVKRIVSACHES